MRTLRITTIALTASLFFATVGYSDLVNPGFEADDASGGDVAGATGWNIINPGLVFTSAQSAPPFEGLNVLKAFGPFNGSPDASGATQALAANAGELWTASAQTQNWSGDALQGDTFGVVQLQFLDGAGAVLGATLESAQVNTSTTQDVWNLLDVSGIAPTGTAFANILLLHVQPSGSNFGGSVFFDNASLSATAIPEPGCIALLSLGALGMVARRRRS